VRYTFYLEISFATLRLLLLGSIFDARTVNLARSIALSVWTRIAVAPRGRQCMRRVNSNKRASRRGGLRVLGVRVCDCRCYWPLVGMRRGFGGFGGEEVTDGVAERGEERLLLGQRVRSVVASRDLVTVLGLRPEHFTSAPPRPSQLRLLSFTCAPPFPAAVSP
jgi:hypothetical protein